MAPMHVLQRAKLGSLWDRSNHKLLCLLFIFLLSCVFGEKNTNFVRACWVAVQFLFFQAKEELLRVIGLQEEEGSSLEFLRRGYKVHLILVKQLIAASKRLLA